MGTYSDSKFVSARKLHVCGLCGSLIERGHRYLVYRIGLKARLKRCYNCATIHDEKHGLQYDCAAVRAELKLPPAIGRKG